MKWNKKMNAIPVYSGSSQVKFSDKSPIFSWNSFSISSLCATVNMFFQSPTWPKEKLTEIVS